MFFYHHVKAVMWNTRSMWNCVCARVRSHTLWALTRSERHTQWDQSSFMWRSRSVTLLKNSENRVSLVTAASWSQQKLQLVCTELEFLCPPPLWPALTWTNKHSSLRTWSVHEVTVFVWFTPEFMRLHLNVMKNDSSTFYGSVQHETWCSQSGLVLKWEERHADVIRLHQFLSKFLN